MAKNIGIFTEMSDTLQSDLMTPFMNKIGQAIAIANPIFGTSVLLFITFYGYMILSGKIQAPAKEFLWRVGIIALVTTVALSPKLYREHVMKPTIYATALIGNLVSEESRQISSGDDYWGKLNNKDGGGEGGVLLMNKVLTGNTNSYLAGLDIVFESVNIFTTAMMNSLMAMNVARKATPAGKESDVKGTDSSGGQDKSFGAAEMMMLGVIGTILTGAVMVYVTAGSILLLNHVFLVVLLGIGPIFLVMAAFKVTREYAKKWAVKTLTIMLTLALVTGMLGFVLKMQDNFSGQLCGVVSQLKVQMKSTMSEGAPLPPEVEEKLEKIEKDVTTRLDSLKLLALDFDTLLAGKFGNPNDRLVHNIQKGCKASISSGSGSTNLLFVAMQYLVLCMLFNRLITEAANMASALIGASGISTNSSSEVSGGVSGMAHKGGMKGKGSTAAGKPTGGG